MNETGHMAVARIAWDVMTPAARREVSTLVADPNDPVSQKPTTAEDSDRFTAACYMDDIRPTLEHLHFDNQFIDAQGHPLQRPADSPNAVTFFNDNVKILEDPSESQDDKAEALRYVMHLAGDLHQPLHCVDRVTPDHPDGDRGGNQFPIRWSAGKWGGNLHAYWDDAAGEFAFIHRPLASDGTRKLNRLAAMIEQQNPEQSFGDQVKDLNPADWAAEGMKIAGTDCYAGIQPGDRPSQAYHDKTIRDMNQEAALGGYRLGTLLNQIFS